MYYLHFTSRADARVIVESMELMTCLYLGWYEAGFGIVYAVQVGGVYAPGVQLSKLGRPATRDCAVLFEAREPDRVFPEEVLWKVPDGTGLKLTSAVAVSLEDAVAALDGSADITDPLD